MDDKGPSATIHYRSAPDPAVRRSESRRRWATSPADGLTLRPGRMSWELRAAGAADKGTAVTQLIARHGLRGLVVLGDDVTDLDMFRAPREARARGELNAAILAVAGGDEVPAAVARRRTRCCPTRRRWLLCWPALL